jgi:valyl-tRNA synthetase
MMNLDGYTPGEPVPETLADRWMFSRLAALVAKLDDAYENYDFGAITRELYAFFWNEFCDWYIELSKPRLQQEGEDRLVCQRNLVFVLNTALRLLHPIMPFVTEKIYQDLPGEKDSEYLMMAQWPDAELLAGYIDKEADRAINMVTSAVSGVRSIRARYGISPKVGLEIIVSAENEEALQLFNDQSALIGALASVEVKQSGVAGEKPRESAMVIAGDVEVFVLLSGLVDFEVERKRIEKEIASLEKDQAKFQKKLSNPGFLAKAAQEIIDKDTAKLSDITDRLEKLRIQLAEM